MPSHVDVNDASRLNFHDQQHVDDAECGRHDNKEVGRDNRPGMIAYKGHPPLRWNLGPLRVLRHVTTDRARRNLDSDLEQEFIRDPFLAPCRIAGSHLDNQLSNVAWNSRPAAWLSFHLQKSPNPFRCQRINVSGFTTVRTECHSKNLAS